MTTTVAVPNHIREPLAELFEEGPPFPDRHPREPHPEDVAWYESMIPWYSRTAAEVREGRIVLHDERDNDGRSLAEFLASEVEEFTTLYVLTERYEGTELLRIEGGLLTLAADIQDATQDMAVAA